MTDLVALARFDLSQLTPPPDQLRVGLGWQVDEQPQGLVQRLLGQETVIDLDAACLVMDKTNNLIELVWYKNLRTRDDSVQHTGDSVTGDDHSDLPQENGRTDQEQILVDLKKMAASVESLLFCVCSHGGHDLSSIKQAHFRVMDARTGDELVRFNLSQQGRHTSVMLARLSRNADQGWNLQALDEPLDAQTPDQIIEYAQRWLAS